MANRKLLLYVTAPLHYHTARARKAYEIGKSVGWDVFLYIGQPKDFSESVPSYLDLFGDIPLRVLDQQIETYRSNYLAETAFHNIEHDNPDVVAIGGYSSRVDRVLLGWCRQHRRGAVLMCSSQSIDQPRSRLKEYLKRQLVSLYDSALVGGNPQKDYVIQLGISPDNIFMGYDTVDNDFWAEKAKQVRFDPENWRKKLGLPENFFLTACRFINKKNLHGLLRSYYQYVHRTKSEPWHLVIVGTGPLEESIQNNVLELSLNNLVHLPGYLSAESIAPYYGLASVFILASSFYEQWGLVVNEAMASGIPVLVSQICGSSRDLVIDGITGYSFDPQQAEQLTELMLKMQNCQIDLKKMGENAQLHIQNWSPDKFGQNLIRSAEIAWEHAQSRKWQIYPPANWWF